uniref:(northern house mosquito) hypothetical protein n=1 Tax=Culex pipiens TaxID=7175 RepID=A0A8D8BLN7_CULPI
MVCVRTVHQCEDFWLECFALNQPHDYERRCAHLLGGESSLHHLRFARLDEPRQAHQVGHASDDPRETAQLAKDRETFDRNSHGQHHSSSHFRQLVVRNLDFVRSRGYGCAWSALPPLLGLDQLLRCDSPRNQVGRVFVRSNVMPVEVLRQFLDFAYPIRHERLQQLREFLEPSQDDLRVAPEVHRFELEFRGAQELHDHSSEQQCRQQFSSGGRDGLLLGLPFLGQDSRLAADQSHLGLLVREEALHVDARTVRQIRCIRVPVQFKLERAFPGDPSRQSHFSQRGQLDAEAPPLLADVGWDQVIPLDVQLANFSQDQLRVSNDWPEESQGVEDLGQLTQKLPPSHFFQVVDVGN